MASLTRELSALCTPHNYTDTFALRLGRVLPLSHSHSAFPSRWHAHSNSTNLRTLNVTHCYICV